MNSGFYILNALASCYRLTYTTYQIIIYPLKESIVAR